MGAPEIKTNALPMAINLGKSTLPPMSDDVRRMFEEASAAMRQAEAEWEAAGRPWTDDQEAFLDRMTGV